MTEDNKVKTESEIKAMLQKVSKLAWPHKAFYKVPSSVQSYRAMETALEWVLGAWEDDLLLDR